MPSSARGLRDAFLGAHAAVPATLVDTVRKGLTSLAGGDVNTLPGGANYFSDAAFGAVDNGLSEFGASNRMLWDRVAGGVRGMLGVQPAPTEPQPGPRRAAPATETPEPAPTPAAEPAPAPETAPTPTPVAAPAPAPAPRGVYDMTNTPRSAPSPNNGINFGFGAGGQTAQQYMAQMALVDQQRQQDRAARRADIELQYATNETRSARTPGEILRARQLMAAAAPVAAAYTQGQQTREQGMQKGLQDAAITALQQAGMLDNTAMQADAALQQAAVTGQFGLLGRQAAADATLQAAALRNASGTNANAAMQAELARMRIAAIVAALQSGDMTTANSLLVGQTAPNTRLLVDGLGNSIGTVTADGTPILYTPEQLAQISGASRAAQGR